MNASAPQAVIPLWRDVRILRIAAQLIFVAVVALLGWWLADNMSRGLARMGSHLTFDFLQSAASFALAESPIAYDTDKPYWYAFLVGALNTLRVAAVGIVLASVLGLVMGIARLSGNWLVARLAQLYVEAFRNTPLLIQLLFWYLAVILKLPAVRQSVELPGPVFLSNRGLTVPWFDAKDSFTPWLLAVLAALVVSALVYQWAGRRAPAARHLSHRGLWAALLFLALAIGSALALDPFKPSIPKLQGFNYSGGLSLSPEYVALLFGLVMYTGAFIAEIVRAGILAVPRGLNEASRALGLTYVQTLRLVTVPLALRVIIPPLTNQYLNLTKNSSLAVAIGYADLFYVSNTIFNQTGQTVQVIVMVMSAYLLMSLTISASMNLVNARFRLKER